MNRTNYPPAFRPNPARRQSWDSKPWADRQWLIHTHGSRQFLAPTARECKGFEPERTDWSEITIIIVCCVGFALYVVLEAIAVGIGWCG
jgi:hypothetical protein